MTTLVRATTGSVVGSFDEPIAACNLVAVASNFTAAAFRAAAVAFGGRPVIAARSGRIASSAVTQVSSRADGTEPPGPEAVAPDALGLDDTVLGNVVGRAGRERVTEVSGPVGGALGLELLAATVERTAVGAGSAEYVAEPGTVDAQAVAVNAIVPRSGPHRAGPGRVTSRSLRSSIRQRPHA